MRWSAADAASGPNRVSSGASGLTMRTLVSACRHSSWLALSSMSAGSPPWDAAPTTIVPAPMVAAYSAIIRPATP